MLFFFHFVVFSSSFLESFQISLAQRNCIVEEYHLPTKFEAVPWSRSYHRKHLCYYAKGGSDVIICDEPCKILDPRALT